MKISAEQNGIPGKAYTRRGMIQRVLAERQERANKAQYRLIRNENSYGEHRIITAQGASYKVTIRSRESGYCSCSDFATNKLGTCKHLMFARKEIDISNPPDPYPFVEIYLDPLKNYQIAWYYPEPLPKQIEALIRLYFGADTHILPQRTMMFFGFVKEAEKFPLIVVRQEVLDKIERAFDSHLLNQKEESSRLDFSKIKGDLLPYQEEGIRMATFRKGVIIADEMGLGKTVQAIGSAVFKKEVFGFSRTLIICPASLKTQWKEEIEKFSFEKVIVVEGNSQQRAKAYASGKAYFMITTYESVLRDVAVINEVGMDFIVLDEAQRIKNFETVTANAIRALRKIHSLVITGTPIENKLADIYAITAFVDPHLLTPLWEFSYQHCYFDPDNESKITGYYNLQALKEKLKPVLIRREKKDVLDQINEVTIIDIPVEMHPVQRDMHSKIARALCTVLGKKFKTAYDWRMITLHLQNMRMVCNATQLLDKDSSYSPKIQELEEILLEKLDLHNNSKKVIIFSEWTGMLRLIAPILQRNGLNFVEYTGNLSAKNRNKCIQEFESNPNCRILLSTEAGGTGLNLQAADTVINMELPWNPARINQRTGRIDRLGQKSKNLTLINLISRNSIEMKVASGLMLKQELFESILDADNQTDEIDFSEKGRSQFLAMLESSMAEFTEPLVDNVAVEPLLTNERTAELAEVMKKGMEFLSAFYTWSTGTAPTRQNVELDQITGDVLIRFSVNPKREEVDPDE